MLSVEKYYSFPRNNKLALDLKIEATLQVKDSPFPGLQPSCLVFHFDIFYKLLYEINLNDCNSFKTSLAKPNFSLDVCIGNYALCPGH